MTAADINLVSYIGWCYNGLSEPEQITIKESLGVGKTRGIAQFPCGSTAFLFYFRTGHAVFYCIQNTSRKV